MYDVKSVNFYDFFFLSDAILLLLKIIYNNMMILKKIYNNMKILKIILILWNYLNLMIFKIKQIVLII
jgi:hypothetical protein